MIFRLFRRSKNEALIERLYADIVAASRKPALFGDLGMIDTFEGRFESLTLHAALVLRRLNGLPQPGPEMAQDLVDVVFRHFDRTFREMGVGDTTVPKKMKRLAEAFLGRSTAYDEALREGNGALARALSRNILARETDAADASTALTRYAEAAVAHLGAMPLEVFVAGQVSFPDPAPFTSKAAP